MRRKLQLAFILFSVSLWAQQTSMTNNLFDILNDKNIKIEIDSSITVIDNFSNSSSGRTLYPKDLVVDGDGNTYVTGYASDNSNPRRAFIFRITNEGRIDSSFGFSGTGIIYDYGAFDLSYNQILLTSENLLIVVGTYKNSSDFLNVYTAGYKLNGSVNVDYGARSFEFEGHQTVEKAMLDNSERVVFSGSYDSKFYIGRLSSTGQLDDSFSEDGIAIIEASYSNRSIYGLDVTVEGKIVGCGDYPASGSYNSASLIVRLNDDGSLDTSFDPDFQDGIVGFDFANYYDFPRAVFSNSDGTVTVAGYYYTGSSYDVFTARLNSNGTKDDSFGGTSGILSFRIDDDVDSHLYVRDSYKDTDSTFILVGEGSSMGFLTRFKLNGEIDSSFGVNGFYRYATGNNAMKLSGVVGAETDYVVTGYTIPTPYDYQSYKPISFKVNSLGSQTTFKDINTNIKFSEVVTGKTSINDAYIELYNASNYDFNLNGFSFLVDDLDPNTIDVPIIVTTDLIIPQDGFLVMGNNLSEANLKTEWLSSGEWEDTSKVVYLNLQGSSPFGKADSTVISLFGTIDDVEGVHDVAYLPQEAYSFYRNLSGSDSLDWFLSKNTRSIPGSLSLNPEDPFVKNITASTLFQNLAYGVLAWGDYNNDGLLDLIMSGQFQGNEYSKLYKNLGNGEFSENTTVALPGLYRGAVEWGDFDGDNDIDLAIMGFAGDQMYTFIYKNEGDETFTDITPFGLAQAADGDIKWIDYDNDGDMDLIVSGFGTPSGSKYFKFYRNAGSDEFEELDLFGETTWVNTTFSIGDYNKDGYLDIAVNGVNDGNYFTAIYKNINGSSFELQEDIVLPEITGDVEWGDYNNDGYLDLAVMGSTGNAGLYSTKLYKNNGDNTFTEIQNSGIVNASSGDLTWGDYNNDGLLDIAITGAVPGTSYTTKVKIYKNLGNDTFAAIDSSMSYPYQGELAWGDYDNDGDLDLITSASELWENNSSVANEPPSVPTSLVTNSLTSGVKMTWNPSIDDHTPSLGLTYNIIVDSVGAADLIKSPMSNSANGFRRIVSRGLIQDTAFTLTGLTPGNYRWALQALDNAYSASDFTDFQSFDIVDNSCQVASTDTTDYSSPFTFTSYGTPPGLHTYSEIKASVVANGKLYIGGSFTGVGGIMAERIAVWDGSTWSKLGNGVDNTVWAMATDGSNVYVAGQFINAGGCEANRVVKWDGSKWHSLGDGLNGDVRDIVVLNGEVYVVGGFTQAGGQTANYIAKWDGVEWSSVGSGLNFTAYAASTDGSNIYVGGWFSSAGGVSVGKIAKWDGSEWSALGPGVNSVVYELYSNGTDLYVGGNFTTAGGISANRIAKWDGSSWTALGSGLNSNPQVITKIDDDLYVGGSFTTAGGNSAKYAAKWDGSSWRQLSSGVNDGNVNSILEFNNSTYVMGAFTEAGDIGAARIAKWDGTQFNSLNSGLSATISGSGVEGLIKFNNSLIAGGRFTIGDDTKSNISIWNESTSKWEWPAESPDNSISAFAEYDGKLIAAGSFANVGNLSAERIAAWDGSNWSALGDGFSAFVADIQVVGNDLYAGGSFTKSGSNTMYYVSRWDGSNWNPLDKGINSSVYDLTTDGQNLYVCGNFSGLISGSSGSAAKIGKWDGTNWSGLDVYWRADVYLVEYFDGSLYAWGDEIIEGQTANKIMKWDGTSWTEVVNANITSLNTMKATPNALYVAHNTNYISKFDGTSWSGPYHVADNAIEAFYLSESERAMYIGGLFNIVGGDTPSALVAKFTDSATPLPVELEAFSVSVEENKVKLNWKTESELNNYGFEIERAINLRGLDANNKNSDLEGFETIGFVEGRGTTNSPQSYSFIDSKPNSGTIKYRLKQIDFDGKYEYSDEVEVKFAAPDKFELAQNYPNPFNPTTSIKFSLPVASKVTLRVYNSIGQEVALLLNETKEAGYHTVEFNASNLASGIYLYRIEAGDFYSIKKMILLK